MNCASSPSTAEGSGPLNETASPAHGGAEEQTGPPRPSPLTTASCSKTTDNISAATAADPAVAKYHNCDGPLRSACHTTSTEASHNNKLHPPQQRSRQQITPQLTSSILHQQQLILQQNHPNWTYFVVNQSDVTQLREQQFTTTQPKHNDNHGQNQLPSHQSSAVILRPSSAAVVRQS
uniref:Uncharacterized protein n=1 Tax=Glossina pallidipes TaxID=7398 RepID=A0A1B0A952_GLOPL